MKNKVKFKKILMLIFMISIVFIVAFQIVQRLEFKTYTNHFNEKLELIIAKVKEEYPNITDNDMVEILNNDEKIEHSILKNYGIDFNKDDVLRK